MVQLRITKRGRWRNLRRPEDRSTAKPNLLQRLEAQQRIVESQSIDGLDPRIAELQEKIDNLKDKGMTSPSGRRGKGKKTIKREKELQDTGDN